jgi:hypothetical protein
MRKFIKTKGIECLIAGLMLVMLNATAINVLALQLQDTSAFPVLYFKGDFPRDLKISYEVIDFETGNHTNEVSENLHDGLVIRKKLPHYALPDEYIKVILKKPAGFDITLPGTKPSQTWKQKELEVNLVNGSRIYLNIQKITTYDFFYLDVSSLKERDKAIQDIYRKIGDITDNGNRYGLFISNAAEELTAMKGDEYISALKAAGILKPDPPNGKTDREKILKTFDWDKILKSNKSFCFHFYIPESTYRLSIGKLLPALLEAIENRRWDVNIYTDFDPDPIEPESNNYEYMNILKSL